jgi:hypothetical protein
MRTKCPRGDGTLWVREAPCSGSTANAAKAGEVDPDELRI